MADISDVQNALVSAIDAALYPNGDASPSISGSVIRIYAGWPASAGLTADLAAGTSHVTVYPKADERNTTRFSKDQQVITAANPTLTLTVSGQIVTVGGTVSMPQVVGLLINGLPYVYTVLATDTLNTIASALQGLVVAAISGTTVTGAAVTVGATGRIQAARVSANGTVAAEVRRQEKTVQITVWAPTPSLRDQIGAALDAALCQIEFLTLPDGFGGRLIYKGTLPTDGLQKESLYRRDFNYTVEYPTTVTTSATQILIEKLNVTGGISPVIQAIQTIYS